MSLSSQIVSDREQIHTVDGDSVTLTPPGGATQSVKGDVKVIEWQTDAETEQVFNEPRVSVTVSLAHITSPETDSDSWRGWLVKTTDATGAAVSGYPASARRNPTLGTVTFVLEDYTSG